MGEGRNDEENQGKDGQRGNERGINRHGWSLGNNRPNCYAEKEGSYGINEEWFWQRRRDANDEEDDASLS